MTTTSLQQRAARVVRFTLSERAIHWIVAISFFSMLGSGLLMGHRGSFHDLMYAWHLVSASILVLGVALVVLGGDRRVLARTRRELAKIDALDRAWLANVPAAVLGQRPQPPAGRFNAGQKLNFILISSLLSCLLVSGIGLVIAGNPPTRIFKVAHVAAAYLSVLLVLGHLYMALVNPGTRPALSGMFSGKVDLAWLRKHHPRAVTGEAAPDTGTKRRASRVRSL